MCTHDHDRVSDPKRPLKPVQDAGLVTMSPKGRPWRTEHVHEHVRSETKSQIPGGPGLITGVPRTAVNRTIGQQFIRTHGGLSPSHGDHGIESLPYMI